MNSMIDPPSPTTQNLFTLAGRILLAGIFVFSGFGKISGFEGTAGYIASKGLPFASIVTALAIMVELGGGLALIAGFKARWAALALAVFTLLAAFIFHNFWAMPPAEQMGNMINFMKNISITGGMLMIAAFGPGGWSIDARKPYVREA